MTASLRLFSFFFLSASALFAQTLKQNLTIKNTEGEETLPRMSEIGRKSSPMMMVKLSETKKKESPEGRLTSGQTRNDRRDGSENNLLDVPVAEELKQEEMAIVASTMEEFKREKAKQALILYLEELSNSYATQPILESREKAPIDDEGLLINKIEDIVNQSIREHLEELKNKLKDNESLEAYDRTYSDNVLLDLDNQALPFNNDKKADLLTNAYAERVISLKLERKRQKRSNMVGIDSLLTASALSRSSSDEEVDISEPLKILVDSVKKRLQEQGKSSSGAEVELDQELNSVLPLGGARQDTSRIDDLSGRSDRSMSDIEGGEWGLRSNSPISLQNETLKIEDIKKVIKDYLNSTRSRKDIWSVAGALATAIKGLPFIRNCGVTPSVEITLVMTAIGEITRPWRKGEAPVTADAREKQAKKENYQRAIKYLMALRHEVTEETPLNPSLNILDYNDTSDIAEYIQKVQKERAPLLYGFQQMDFYKKCSPLRRRDIVMAFDQAFPKGKEISSQTPEKIRFFVEEQMSKNETIGSYLYYTAYHPVVLCAAWTLANAIISAERFQSDPLEPREGDSLLSNIGYLAFCPEIPLPLIEQQKKVLTGSEWLMLLLWKWSTIFATDFPVEYTGAYRERNISDDAINQLIGIGDTSSQSVGYIDQLGLSPATRSSLWSTISSGSVVARVIIAESELSFWPKLLCQFGIALLINRLGEQNLAKRQHVYGKPWYGEQYVLPEALQTPVPINAERRSESL